jgi:hypothetical protein
MNPAIAAEDQPTMMDCTDESPQDIAKPMPTQESPT